MTAMKSDSLLVDGVSDRGEGVHEHSHPIYNQNGVIDRKFYGNAYSSNNKFNSSSHQICLQCGKTISINSTQLCSACARRNCKACGNSFRLTMRSFHSEHCAICRHKRRNKKNEI